MADEILRRSLTPDEKTDMIELGTETYEDAFRRILHAKEQEYVKAHKPYCTKMAHEDFEDTVNMKMASMKRAPKSQIENIKLNQLGINLEKYGDLKNFELLSETDVQEDKLQDGMKTQVITGVYRNYVFKGTKYSVSVYVPNKTLEAERAAKK